MKASELKKIQDTVANNIATSCYMTKEFDSEYTAQENAVNFLNSFKVFRKIWTNGKDICRNYKADKSYTDLSNIFNQLISQIQSGKSWKEIRLDGGVELFCQLANVQGLKNCGHSVAKVATQILSTPYLVMFSLETIAVAMGETIESEVVSFSKEISPAPAPTSSNSNSIISKKEIVAIVKEKKEVAEKIATEKEIQKMNKKQERIANTKLAKSGLEVTVDLRNCKSVSAVKKAFKEVFYGINTDFLNILNFFELEVLRFCGEEVSIDHVGGCEGMRYNLSWGEYY